LRCEADRKIDARAKKGTAPDEHSDNGGARGRFPSDVRPTVFHPRYFLTSEFFANFLLASLDLTGKRVADVGTGSGILALAAARVGAANVVAIDINPNAAEAAAENAHANGLGRRIMAVGSDLLSALAPRPSSC
jgi:release factor glutamine methyltransferase